MGIKILQLRSDGQYSLHKGVRDPEFPGAVLCPSTEQQFSTVDNPMFPDQEILYPEKKDNGSVVHRPFLTMRELTDFRAPIVRRENDKTLMIVAEDDFKPITPKILLPVDELQVRNNIMFSFYQDGLNRGRARADKMAAFYQSAVILTAAAIAGVSTVIVGALFLGNTVF